jgi:hypothetical protein
MTCSDEILSAALFCLLFRSSLLVGLNSSAVGCLTTAELQVMEIWKWNSK